MSPTVGVAIPTIPPRKALLQRAIKSVMNQTVPVSQISVVVDIDKEGAGATRNRARNALTTDWVAYLDDDDELLPHHVETLLRHAEETGADVVYPWFEVKGGMDPFPQFQGLEWDPNAPRIFPVTALVRREVAVWVDFPPPSVHFDAGGEDYTYWCELNRLGAVISHTPEVTWRWDHCPPGGNTSGRPERVR